MSATGRNIDVRDLRWPVEDPDVLDALSFLERLFVFVLVTRDGFVRCGDTVTHAPTGETWLVAFADYERLELGWCGWPEGYGHLVHCSLRASCSDEEHQAEVARWLEGPHDIRRSAVRRLYAEGVSQ